jgi:two-component sensor histidine kinase
VRHGDVRLLDRVERGFNSIPEKTHTEILRKWVGYSFTPNAQSVPIPMPLRIVLASMVLGSFLAVIVFFLGKIESNKNELSHHIRRFESSEKWNKAVIRAFPDLYFIVDKNGYYIDYCTSDPSLLKVGPKGIVGSRVTDVFSIQDSRRIMDAIDSVLSNGGVFHLEYELDVEAGHRYFDCRVVPFDSDKALYFSRDISERVAHEESTIRALYEKEILLREIHHRVKNNLQVISSLISLQLDQYVDERDQRLMLATQQRIHSMSQLHEMLYQSRDFLSIRINEYINGIIDEIAVVFHSISPHVTIIRELAEFNVSLENALPLGLIVNELVTNGLKYAFVRNGYGVLEISLKLDGDIVSLTVRDNGIGLPEGISVEGSTTLGFALVRSLAEQLRGSVTAIRGMGTCVCLRFDYAAVSHKAESS